MQRRSWPWGPDPLRSAGRLLQIVQIRGENFGVAPYTPPPRPTPTALRSIPFSTAVSIITRFAILIGWKGWAEPVPSSDRLPVDSGPKLSQCYTWTNTVTLAVTQYCVHTCDYYTE